MDSQIFKQKFMRKNCQPKHRKRYNSAEMEEGKQALIHQRYDKAYKRLLGNPEAFCPKFFYGCAAW